MPYNENSDVIIMGDHKPALTINLKENEYFNI
mgnify:CR=1 FL=1